MSIPEHLQRNYQYCLQLVRDHYENFPVASLIIPRHLRPHIAALYAYARIADDLADESRDAAALQQWREYLWRFPDASTIPHPVFAALFHTMQQFSLPITLLDDLLTAFQMDVEGTTFYQWEDLIHYSRYSANPVGRLLLLLFGYRDEELFPLSDAICTALQLTNFWQDLSIDLSRQRCYLPLKELQEQQLQPDLAHLQANPGRFLPLFHSLINRTQRLYHQGIPLIYHLSGRFGLEIRLVLHGGIQMLHRVNQLQAAILQRRPTLTLRDWLFFLWRPAYRRLATQNRKQQLHPKG